MTLALVPGLGGLRRGLEYMAVLEAFERGRERAGFRLIHYSIQHNHLHLIVEAETNKDLSQGMSGISIRIARALNRLWDRTGPVWGDRYHARSLASPTETRNALLYVLQNGIKHHVVRPGDLDPCSSACSFAWSDRPTPPPLPTTSEPSTWLLRTGWTRAGAIRRSMLSRPMARARYEFA